MPFTVFLNYMTRAGLLWQCLEYVLYKKKREERSQGCPHRQNRDFDC